MNADFDDVAGARAGAGADAVLIGLMATAFDEGRAGHEAADVLTRGRQLRRRKRAMPAFGAMGIVAAAAGLALAMSGPGGAAGPAVNVDKAAFSVHTDATTGNVTITIRQVLDENELKSILAKAGIHAIFAPETIHLGEGQPTSAACTWPGATALPTLGVFINDGGNSMTIVRSKLPSGAVLAYQYYTVGDGTITTSTLLSNEPTGCGA